MDVVCKLELKERGVPGGEGTAVRPGRTGSEVGGLVKNGSKNGSSFLHDLGAI